MAVHEISSWNCRIYRRRPASYMTLLFFFLEKEEKKKEPLTSPMLTYGNFHIVEEKNNWIKGPTYWNFLYWKAKHNLLVKFFNLFCFQCSYWWQMAGSSHFTCQKLTCKSPWLRQEMSTRMLPGSQRELIWFTFIHFREANFHLLLLSPSLEVKAHYFKWNPSVKLCLEHTVANEDGSQ